MTADVPLEGYYLWGDGLPHWGASFHLRPAPEIEDQARDQGWSGTGSQSFAVYIQLASPREFLRFLHSMAECDGIHGWAPKLSDGTVITDPNHRHNQALARVITTTKNFFTKG